MAGLVLRLFAYVLLAFGLKRWFGGFWRYYRHRVIFALKVGGGLWLTYAAVRFVIVEHRAEQWTALAVGILAMGGLYAAVWVATKIVSRRKR